VDGVVLNFLSGNSCLRIINVTNVEKIHQVTTGVGKSLHSLGQFQLPEMTKMVTRSFGLGGGLSVDAHVMRMDRRKWLLPS